MGLVALVVKIAKDKGELEAFNYEELVKSSRQVSPITTAGEKVPFDFISPPVSDKEKFFGVQIPVDNNEDDNSVPKGSIDEEKTNNVPIGADGIKKPLN